MNHIYNRNLKSLDNKTGKKITEMIGKFIKCHEKHKTCYFWSVNMSANQRRNQEFNDTMGFVLNGIPYCWQQRLDISCKNFYFTSKIFVDGNKKDIRAIKKLLRENNIWL